MPEMRRDPVVGRWVLVHTQDSVKPDSFEVENHLFKQQGTCQFCTGKEALTPPEVDVVRAEGSAPNTPGWSVRVVPNKFPALRIEGELNKRGLGIYDISNGVGAHEVVIETAEHEKYFCDLSVEEMLNVLLKYQSRYVSLAGDRRFKYILIFKNFGSSAGASQEHTHSQIIALPLIPKYVREELDGAKHYHEFRGRCVFCDVIHQEYQDKERIVSENNDFIAFCPYVPRYAFETWIFPKRHSSTFAQLTREELTQLATVLKEMLTRLKLALKNPSYNFFLHLAPVNYESQESYHWHVEIIPNLTRVAGFEWGTGFYIVPIDPALAAKHLRDVPLPKATP